ncbi:MAG: hypothetical protein ACRER2_03520 [Methylococcales bacterium]
MIEATEVAVFARHNESMDIESQNRFRIVIGVHKRVNIGYVGGLVGFHERRFRMIGGEDLAAAQSQPSDRRQNSRVFELHSHEVSPVE